METICVAPSAPPYITDAVRAGLSVDSVRAWRGVHTGCSVRPRRRSIAWGRSSMMLSSDSQAPRGLPGRFTMSLSFLAPTIPRESAARGVFFIPSARIIWARPGISLSTTARVASGVTSRGPSPVPPEVKTASQSSPSVQARSVRRIRSASSGKISIAPTSHPRLSSNSRTAGPERSSRLPAAAASLNTRILARRGNGM